MGRAGRRGKRYTGSHSDHAKASIVDDLVDFEEFKQKILPAIRKDLALGMPPEALRMKYQALVQASLITTALIDSDSAKRIAAGKDILDRTEGKAKERQEIHHKLENLDENEIDSLLLTKMKDLEQEDGSN